MRSLFRNRPAIALGAVILLAAASASCDLPPVEPTTPVHWLIYLQSDFRYPGSTINAPDQEQSRYERCGEEKFDQIWSQAYALIDRIAREKGSLEIYANLDIGPKRLGEPIAFDDGNPAIAEILASGQPDTFKRDGIDRIIKRLTRQAKAARELHKAHLVKTRQFHQNLFQAVNAMRMVAAETARGPAQAKVVVVFISDMVHYNTRDRSQFNLETGHANMLLDADRAAIMSAQAANEHWWVGGDTLTPLGAPGAVEMRVVLVSRCASGEALPGDVVPNWMKVHTDIRDIWTRVAKALRSDLVWGYRPS